MYAGGTILNWAGRVPELERIEEVSGRETVEVDRWDTSLEELREDPEVEEAIDAIDSDPPPAPFVRSSPPGFRPPDEVTEQKAKPARDDMAADGESQERSQTPRTHSEDPKLRPRAEVPAKGEITVSLRAPRSVHSSSIATEKPSKLPWALLLLGVGIGVTVLLVSTPLKELVFEAAPATKSEPAAVADPLGSGPGSMPGLEPPPESAQVSESTTGPGSTEEPESSLGSTQEPEGDPDPDAPKDPTTVPAPSQVPAVPTVPAPPPGAPTVPAPPPSPAEAPEPAPAIDSTAINPNTGVADSYEAHLALGRELKRGSRAVAAYRRAIELNPRGSEALAELARLMLGRQRPREAAGLAQRATAVDPNNALGWITLGAARQMWGDREGARQAYESCAKLGPGPYVKECRAMLR